MATPFQKKAAQKVDRLYSGNVGDSRYMRNLTGQGSGVKATGTVVPQAKIADAISLARSEDHKNYVAAGGKKAGPRPVAEEAAKRVKLLDALMYKRK